MSDNKKRTEAEEIFSEFQKTKEGKQQVSEPAFQGSESQTVSESKDPPPQERVESESTSNESQTETTVDSISAGKKETKERNVIFVGVKPIMTYVTATLTQLSTQPTVTIKARGKRITQAADVSQMIIKRMNTVGYQISDVRIASDALTSQDGKKRNVSTIEIDITRN